MQINVGIVGYGNLGKALKKELMHNDEFNLIAIFSKRNVDGCENIDSVLNYKNEIDILFLCVGSQEDLQPLALKLAEHFNLIDVYDNHSVLKDYISTLNKKSISHSRVCFSALGWDPGVFSLIRGLFASLNLNFITTWGKGVSQGHTNAIKNISNVIDAIQFTIPLKRKIKEFTKFGKIVPKQLHLRKCFVVAKHNRQKIKKQILNMEHYFKGYKTKVKFISQRKLNKLKTSSHKGEILTYDNIANFSLNLKSNAEFTAKIMITYSRVLYTYIQNKVYGAFSILDIPIGKLIEGNEYQYL